MSNSEAFETFLKNAVGENDQFRTHYLNNNIVNRCVQQGFYSGMSEIETLRSLIVVIVKLADEDLERKMMGMMTSPPPVVTVRKCNKTPSGGWGTMKCGKPLADGETCDCDQVMIF